MCKNQICDSYHTHFSNIDDMMAFWNYQNECEQWISVPVPELSIVPIDGPKFAEWGADVDLLSIDDTRSNTGLAIVVKNRVYPLGSTAIKSLLDRAKISGSVLSKLQHELLADILSACMAVHKTSDALVLIRNGKCRAVQSGDPSDYSRLDCSELLAGITSYLDASFPGHQFKAGYADHSITAARWTLAGQKDALIGAYLQQLDAVGLRQMASHLEPSILFQSSDVGLSSAKISAQLVGMQGTITIGTALAVDHRHKKTVADFNELLPQLFSQFGEQMSKIQRLLTVPLEYPVNVLTRLCKKYALPKKAAMEAISNFELIQGKDAGTAHDVFMALQDVLFLLKRRLSVRKLLTLDENVCRVLEFTPKQWDVLDSAWVSY